ncbi:MAG TPA: hypothetical protein VHX14_20755 [Thermoanaerobaculia bacterium]|jgi:hypothetical protein|nr:hypothetical protein [Thermoanaerobaculia bacterium]
MFNNLTTTGLILAMTVISPPLRAATRHGDSAWPKICENETLASAVRVIDSACGAGDCNPETLRQLDKIDRSKLIAAMRSAELYPTHIFFPPDQFAVAAAIDWKAGKDDQLSTFVTNVDRKRSTVYIIGQASITGPSTPVENRRYNFKLSRQRMAAVMGYLESELHLKCFAIKGGFLGNDIFQLTESDAGNLRIPASDYHNDPLILNQAVHIFAYPCADKIY